MKKMRILALTALMSLALFSGCRNPMMPPDPLTTVPATMPSVPVTTEATAPSQKPLDPTVRETGPSVPETVPEATESRSTLRDHIPGQERHIWK